jgi:hypothetical protein
LLLGGGGVDGLTQVTVLLPPPSPPTTSEVIDGHTLTTAACWNSWRGHGAVPPHAEGVP